MIRWLRKKEHETDPLFPPEPVVAPPVKTHRKRRRGWGIFRLLTLRQRVILVWLLLMCVAMCGWRVYAAVSAALAKIPARTGPETLIAGTVPAKEFDEEYWTSARTLPPEPTAAPVREIPEGAEPTLLCTIVDVGQGSCAVLESGGEYVIIDTGDIKTVSPAQQITLAAEAAMPSTFTVTSPL